MKGRFKEKGRRGKSRERGRDGPRNGRRSRKAIYLLEALLSPAIRERSCRQIRHVSRIRRINLATKDPPKLSHVGGDDGSHAREKKQTKRGLQAYEASCVIPRIIINISGLICISKTRLYQ